MEQEFKILFLEAVECSADLIEYELSKTSAHFTLLRVENQESFLRALEDFCPHLIMADCRLRSDGLIALAYAQEICPETPFLFASGDMIPATLMLTANLVSQNRQKKLKPKRKSFLSLVGQESRTC